MWRDRPRLAILAALLVCATPLGCAGAGDDGGGAPAAPAARADLHACDPPISIGTGGHWRCGEIEVPFERSDPSLGTTEVAFAVRRRNQPKLPSEGAIFTQEGGPGYASTGTLNSYVKLMGSLLDRREMVAVDMRGTGRSHPLACPDLQLNRAPEWIGVSECARRLGPRFESYRTSAAADDLDDVRRALGLSRITLYGDSYGTFLGQSYAFRHGERLNALVLDSAYPAFGEDPWYPSLPRHGNRSMEIACRRVERCSGDAGKRLEELVAYLRRRQLSVGPLIDAIESATYGTPQSYVDIDRAGQKLLDGNPKPYKRLTRERPHGYRHIQSYDRAEELVVGCNDYPMIWEKDASEPERRGQLEQAIRDYDQDAFLPFTPREVALSSTIGYLYCLTFPGPTDRYEPAVDPKTDEPTKAPVLVVSGELDDLTTPIEGRTVAGFFPNSRQYIARNAGHVISLYDSHSPAARQIRAFLREELGG
jgi:pimeloyl-ACP methyl ester carboxylesterase